MALYLVVAHQTAASPELVGKLKEISATDREAEFVLLVPATPIKHLLTWEEGDTREIAARRARESATVMSQAGLDVIDAIVGARDPLSAVRNEYQRRPGVYAMTIIGTLPTGVSRWLQRDLPNQIRRQLGIEVLEVVSRSVEATSAKSSTLETADEDKIEAVSLDLRQLAAWRGANLRCTDGPLGQLKEIIYDYVSQEPIWFGVASHPLPFRTMLVPVSAVSISRGLLICNLPRTKILAQPPTQVGEGFASLTDEEHVCHYFGLSFSELRDVRVLRVGEPVPGGERNQQAIFAVTSTT